MNLPKEAERVLKANLKFCFDDKFEVTEEDTKWFQEELGVANSKSSFISFYTIVAIPPVGKGAELLPLDSIMENAKLDVEELPCGVGTRFIRLTSFEGEGAYYFDIESDKIYDVGWGAEEDMVNGMHPALAESFYSFLGGYYERT